MIRRKLRFPHALWQPPLRHDRFDDSNTYNYWKVCLYAKRHVFNSVNWFSHYTRNNFQHAILKIECSFILAQLTCIWHTDSPLISSPLPLVGFIKVSDDFKSQTSMFVITSHHLVHSFMPPLTWSLLSFDLLPYHQHSWPLLCITTLITSCLLYWLQPMVTKSTTKSFWILIKLSSITTTKFILVCHLHFWSTNL